MPGVRAGSEGFTAAGGEVGGAGGSGVSRGAAQAVRASGEKRAAAAAPRHGLRACGALRRERPPGRPRVPVRERGQQNE